MSRNIVITGIGCISPIGGNLEETWSNMLKGVPGVGEVKGITPDPEYMTKLGAVLKKDNARKAGNVSDETVSIMLECIDQTLRAYPVEPETLKKSGLIVGTTAAGMSTFESFHRKYNKYGRKIRGMDHLYEGIVGSLLSCVMEQTAAELELTGPCTTIESACASGAAACAAAYDLISLGHADIMLTAGVDLLCDVTYSGFSSLRVMEDELYRPFDAARKGLVLGEAAAFMILESEEHARARGAKILARLAGCGLSCDAMDMTAPDNEGRGAAEAMKKALRQAGLRPSDIDYINAHGTGTPLNDTSESAAIRLVFGAEDTMPWVSSTKSMTGHTLGAAGMLEAVISVLCLRDGKLPPTIKLEVPDEQCRLRHIAGSAVEQPVKAVMSNSFGFGGINVALIFTQTEEAQHE